MKIATGGGKVKIGGLRGLVGHWTMSQDSLKSLTILADKTPYGNDGTIYGATFATDRHGQPNKAMSFDGVNDYVNCGNGASLNITEAITISAWMKLNSGAGTGYIISKNSLGIADRQYSIFWQSYNRLVLSLNGSDCGGSANNSVLTGQWYHIAIVWNKIDVRYYVNGVLSGTPFAYSTALTPTDFTVNIGRRKPNNYYFNGLIDDVRIYNRALSAEEIKLLYESYNPNLKI